MTDTPGEPYCHRTYNAIRGMVDDMKTSITIRVDPQLLAAARQCALRENRTLTNFIETVLQRRVAEVGERLPGRADTTGPREDTSTDAR